MSKNIEVKFDPQKVKRVAALRSRLRWTEAELNTETLLLTGVVLGEVLRDRNSGARYIVENARAYFNNAGEEPRVVIQGRRTYNTDRHDASHTSHLSLHTLEREG